MDELLPVFIAVLVRSNIAHLGAEIQFLLDFLDPSLITGESGVLLTTLQAAYCPLQSMP